MNTNPLYPLKFAPVYKQIIWGGTKIRQRFGRETPFDKVAESWELCCRSDGMGVVTNGPLAGKSFESLIADYQEALLGQKSVTKYGNEFPLLIKLIDANDQLSVQVHPDDEYAKLEGEANGKNEMWYIIDARQDAKLIYGLKDGVSRQQFTDAVASGNIAGALREVPVKPGDCLFIPAGTVHAILSGILIAEIQQNSNTTYRIYDWGRVDANGKGRELHLDKALDVIRFGTSPKVGSSDEIRQHDGYDARELLRSDYFNVDEITVRANYNGVTDGSFLSVISIEGSGNLTYAGGELSFTAGETILLPACLGSYSVTGGCKLLIAGL